MHHVHGAYVFGEAVCEAALPLCVVNGVFDV